MQADFDLIQSLIDSLAKSDEDRVFLKAAVSTDGQIPSISSPEQHEAYLRLERELSRRLFDPSRPDYSKGFAEWVRSSEGILAAAYGAKVIEWEERHGAEVSREAQGETEGERHGLARDADP